MGISIQRLQKKQKKHFRFQQIKRSLVFCAELN